MLIRAFPTYLQLLFKHPLSFLHLFLVPAAVLPGPLQSKVKQWFPHGVTFPRPQHSALQPPHCCAPTSQCQGHTRALLCTFFCQFPSCRRLSYAPATESLSKPWGGVKSVDARPIEIQP